MIKKTLAILAGGKGSRMNYQNKALLYYKNKTFIQHLIENVKNFDEILIVAKNKEVYKNYNVKIVEDIYKEKGPLGGIYTALNYSKFDKVFCIACDMPLLKRETLEKIASIEFDENILVPKVDCRMQPLCAIYSKKLIPQIEKNIKSNNNKMIYLIENTTHKIIDTNFSNIDFYNVNTLNEYNKLEDISYDYSRNNN